MLLKSNTWTGYRDKALFGLADAHARAGRPAKSLEWLETLKETYPKSYEKHKLAEYRKSLELRVKSGPKPTLGIWQTGFEPGEDKGFGEPIGWPVVRGLGMRGPTCWACVHSALVHGLPGVQLEASDQEHRSWQ